jgi:bifunctional non-homologous end joining protein LigD
MARHRAKPPTIGAKAPYPGFVEPALASSIAKVPAGDRWIHEVKFDGYRVQVHLASEAVKVFTRRGNDWTKRFKKIADDAWHIGAGSAIIDGEVIVPSENGVSDFSVLQNELRGKSNKPLRLRPTLSQRLRSAKGSALRAQGMVAQVDCQDRHPV